MEQITTMEIKRFDIKIEPRVITALSRLLNQSTNPLSEEEALKKQDLWITDFPNVCMVQALTEESKRVLSRFVDKEETKRTLPLLKYEGCYGTGSKFSIEYLKKIIDLFNACNKEEAVKMFVSKDYPGTFENKYFKIVLAPRCGED